MNNVATGVFVEVGDKRWQDALERIPHDVYHTPKYLEICAAQNLLCSSRCYVWQWGDYVGLVPLMITPCSSEINDTIGGGSDAVSPYGYSGPIVAGVDRGDVPLDVNQKFLNDFILDSKEAGIIATFLRGHPILSSACKAFEGDGSVEVGTTYGISLKRDMDSLLSSYRSAFKRSIKKIEKMESISIKWDNWDDITHFVPLYHENMSRLNAQQSYYFDLDYFNALQHSLPNNFHLLSVFDGEKYIGGVCAFICNGIVQYHLPACLDEWRDAGLPKFLINELVKWGKQKNCTVVHLGGGVGGKEDSLSYFKSGFADMHYPFRVYKIIVNSEKYSVASEYIHNKVLNLGLTLDNGFFPIYKAA